MFLTIGAFIVVTIATAAFVAPRLLDPHIVFDQTPDAPAPFGYRMAWLAVRTTNTGLVAQALGLGALEPANWRTGIGTVYEEKLAQGRVFLSPPVNGWTFVVGLSLPQPLGRGFTDKCTPMLLDLAAVFPEAQYYLCYGPMELYAWAKVADGKLIRAFAIGDEGIIWNKGKVTRDERSIGLRFAEVRGVKGRKADVGGAMPVYPTEAHVMQLASCWSVDPISIASGKVQGGLGYMAATPPTWRPERLRRSA